MAKSSKSDIYEVQPGMKDFNRHKKSGENGDV